MPLVLLAPFSTPVYLTGFMMFFRLDCGAQNPSGSIATGLQPKKAF